MLRNWTFIRHYARRANNTSRVPAGMPGLNKLAKELQDVDKLMTDPEGFGDFESDFMNVHKSYKQHEREQQQHREKVRHLLVGQKYFKIKNPNFLTYAEKEQIRLLHSRDPQEWNAERLSESFPATPEIIGQIIKGKWVATDENRIQRHDRSVLNNWQMLREGKLTELDPMLKEHIKKFANRTAEDMKSFKVTVPPKPELPKPSRTEFLSIITEGMKFKKSDSLTKKLSAPANPNNPFVSKERNENASKTGDEHIHHKPVPPPSQVAMENETYLLDKVKNMKPMRFQDLMRNNKDLERATNSMSIHQIENPQGTGILEFSRDGKNESHVEKFKADEVEIQQQDMIGLSSAIRERIHIPKHLRRKGSTYKFSDCYYDDDGEFLYRVPGMTGQQRGQ